MQVRRTFTITQYVLFLAVNELSAGSDVYAAQQSILRAFARMLHQQRQQRTHIPYSNDPLMRMANLLLILPPLQVI